MKENKGITLVALIITIIVMLILVGVTISAVVQSDIIGQGEEAARAYENKQAEEQSLNPTYDNKTVKDYLDKVQTSTNTDPEPSGEDDDTYIGKYFSFTTGNTYIKIVSSEVIYLYQKQNENWYYNIMTFETLFEGDPINKSDDTNFIEYCNESSINIEEIAETIYRVDSGDWRYFNSEYTTIYEGWIREGTETMAVVCEDNDIITQLENAILFSS